ncbi:MAG: hypothetical protein U9Q30_08235, partial [Campylobacterota bacterium]|nr:hypothetical protein [Campylobacterota bacterium]
TAPTVEIPTVTVNMELEDVTLNDDNILDFEGGGFSWFSDVSSAMSDGSTFTNGMGNMFSGMFGSSDLDTDIPETASVVQVSGTTTNMEDGDSVEITITDGNGDSVDAIGTVAVDGSYTVNINPEDIDTTTELIVNTTVTNSAGTSEPATDSLEPSTENVDNTSDGIATNTSDGFMMDSDNDVDGNSWKHDEVITGTDGRDDIDIKSGERKEVNAGDGDDYILKDDGGHDTEINGEGGDDHIHMNESNVDRVDIDGGTGNDTIHYDTTSGNRDHTVDGGEGLDTIKIDGKSDDFQIVNNNDGSFSIDSISGNQWSTWSNGDFRIDAENIEAVEFNDTTYVLNSDGNEFVDSSDSSADELLTAVLVDGVVEGVAYETTSGVTGTTDASGNFSFREGDDVTFSVGGVTLGTATSEDIAEGHTFLQDIADVDRTDLNDEYLENMATFLQSVDTPDSGDNIVITPEVHEALADAEIDLKTATEEEVTDLVESIGATYVEEDVAMEHVQDMLEEYAGIDESEFDEHIDDDLQTATFGTEAPEGISFTTSSGVEGTIGIDGEFTYEDGDTITFTDSEGNVIATIDASDIGTDGFISMDEIVSLAAKETTEEVAEEPTEEVAEEPTEEVAEEPTEEVAEEPTEEVAEEPT